MKGSQNSLFSSRNSIYGICRVGSKNHNIRAWRTWSWVSSGWENVKWLLHPCSHTACFWPEQSRLLVHRHSQPQPACQADPVLLLRILLSLQVEIKSCQRSSNHPLLTFWKNIFTFTFTIPLLYDPFQWMSIKSVGEDIWFQYKFIFRKSKTPSVLSGKMLKIFGNMLTFAFLFKYSLNMFQKIFSPGLSWTVWNGGSWQEDNTLQVLWKGSEKNCFNRTSN